MEGLWALGERQGCGQLSLSPRIQHRENPAKPAPEPLAGAEPSALGRQGALSAKLCSGDPERQRVRQGGGSTRLSVREVQGPGSPPRPGTAPACVLYKMLLLMIINNS